MWLNEIIDCLCGEANRIARGGANTTWYLFGSVTRSFSRTKDVDLLVVCDSHETAMLVRAELEDTCLRIPLHLLLLTRSEESELGFVESEECVQIYPKLAGILSK